MKILRAGEWGRKLLAGKSLTPMTDPASYWVIHHTAGGTSRSLADELRLIDEDARGEGKTCIDYSFAVNLAGEIGEGRGWRIRGAHTKAPVPDGWAGHGGTFNEHAHALVFIGNYERHNVSVAQMKAAEWLIDEGVRLGHVRPDYRTIGHRDVWPTLCPGEHLYALLGNFNTRKPDEHPVDLAAIADSLRRARTKVLRRGDTGDAVEVAQRILNARGAGPIDADGVFGRDTQRATLRFQRRHGLTPDAVIGPKTWAKLLANLAF